MESNPLKNYYALVRVNYRKVDSRIILMLLMAAERCHRTTAKCRWAAPYCSSGEASGDGLRAGMERRCREAPVSPTRRSRRPGQHRAGNGTGRRRRRARCPTRSAFNDANRFCYAVAQDGDAGVVFGLEGAGYDNPALAGAGKRRAHGAGNLKCLAAHQHDVELRPEVGKVDAGIAHDPVVSPLGPAIKPSRLMATP